MFKNVQFLVESVNYIYTDCQYCIADYVMNYLLNSALKLLNSPDANPMPNGVL